MLISRAHYGALLFAIVLTGCGGGGGSDFEPAEPITARGFYDVTLSNGRTGGLVVLGDGTYWGIYSTVSNDNIVAGVIQGTGTENGNTFTSSNGRDFNLEIAEILSFSVASTFSEMASFSGTATYSGGGGTVMYTGTYDDSFDDTPSLTAIAGSYSGEAVSSGGNELAQLTINGSGNFTGSGGSGCTFSGTVTPRTDGNVFNLSVRFNGGVCVNGTATLNGIAVYDDVEQAIIGVVLNGSRSDGVILIGAKS